MVEKIVVMSDRLQRRRTARRRDEVVVHRQPTEFHEAPGEADADAVSSAFLQGVTLNPARQAAALSTTDSATRARVISRLQQMNGNRYAQKVIQRLAVQRFGEQEHMTLGDEGTKSEYGELKKVRLADDYRVTYGEMVAMGGDHFESIGQMRELAQKPGPGAGTREEIEYVRIVKVHGKKDQTDKFSKAARDAADERYSKLFLNNRTHFLNPVASDENRSTQEKSQDTVQQIRVVWFQTMTRNVPAGASAAYRQNHLQALFEAYLAGLFDGDVESALAVEAFSNHFLTDAFSAGHVRTARVSIEQHWNERVPTFFEHLKQFVAERMASKLSHWYLPVGEEYIYERAQERVSATLGKMGELNFGALVAGAIHDYDNEHGIRVTIGGSDAFIKGDSHLGEGDEKKFATQAVRLSYEDVLKAFKAGKAKQSPLDALAALTSDGLFAAEALLPKPKPDAELPASEQRIKWDYADATALLGDAKFQAALKIFAKNKESDFAEVPFDSESQKTAFQDGVVKPLVANPAAVVQEIINLAPHAIDPLVDLPD
jgi:hypothetical protein